MVITWPRSRASDTANILKAALYRSDNGSQLFTAVNLTSMSRDRQGKLSFMT